MRDEEKLAEEWANKRCPESGTEFVVWQMCKEDYLAGHDQGCIDTKQRIWAKIKQTQNIAEFHTLHRLAGAVSMNDLSHIIFGQANTGGEEVLG